MSIYGYNRYLRGSIRVMALLSMTLLTLTVVFSGCSSPQTTSGVTSTATNTPSEVVLLDIIIRKIDTSSGIQFWLLPKNKSAVLVSSEGSVDATLWFQQPIDTDGIAKRGELMQKWEGIPVTGDSYEQFLGSSITLEYIDSNKNMQLADVFGFLDVKFTLPDGTVLVTEETFVKISENYSCCGSSN